MKTYGNIRQSCLIPEIKGKNFLTLSQHDRDPTSLHELHKDKVSWHKVSWTPYLSLASSSRWLFELKRSAINFSFRSYWEETHPELTVNTQTERGQRDFTYTLLRQILLLQRYVKIMPSISSLAKSFWNKDGS